MARMFISAARTGSWADDPWAMTLPGLERERVGSRLKVEHRSRALLQEREED